MLESLEDISKELNDLSKYMHNTGCGLTFQRFRKLTASYQKLDDELATISNLIESHAVVLRQKTAMRYKLMLIKTDITDETRQTLEMLKDIVETPCGSSISDRDGLEKICSRVAEMPKEWNIIQITSDISEIEIQNVDPDMFETNPLYLTVFNCGQLRIEPFLIKIPEPRDNVERNKLEILAELKLFLKLNKERMMNSGQKTFANQKMKMNYYFAKQETEQNLKKLVKNVESMWLKQWRCLFIGKYIDSSLEEAIRNNIEDFLNTEFPLVQFSSKSKELMYYLTKGTHYLTLNELKSGVKQCCEDEKKVRKLAKFLKDLNEKLGLRKKARHPVILVIDESHLDNFPWEMLDVLQDEPVSRVPSFHFVYFLYKIYENEIVGGHKIISRYKTGTYVVNPDRDLENMEARMMSFYNYWVPHWTGTHNRKPKEKEFLELLTKADIFSYNGHGNGAHILPMEHLQKVHVKAVVLLFGCGSTRICRPGPQAENYGSYHMYLIARCPCVVGMLWEVTDLDTDVLTAEFISSWVPSDANLPWRYLEKSEWKKGKQNVRFDHAQFSSEPCELSNDVLQRALCMAKKVCENYITRAACVVRGLPVKIK